MGAGSHALRREPNHTGRVLVGLVVLLVISLVTFAWWRASAEQPRSTPCTPTAVRLAVPATLAPVVTRAAQDVEEQHCVRLVVTSPTPDLVVSSLVADKEEAAELWVPESRLLAGQLAAQGITSEPLVPSLATSPVVLVGGPSTDIPDSWQGVLSGGRVVLRDPFRSGAGALALAAVRAEQATTGATDDDVAQLLAPLAQQYVGARAALQGRDPLASLSRSSVQLVPSSEQQFLSATGANRELFAVVPRTGTLVLDHPLLALEGASEKAVEAGRELAAYLASGEGRALLADSGFRRPDGAPGRAGVGQVRSLEVPDAEVLQGDLRQWLVLSVPSSVLAVIDVSGSMDEATPGGSRIQLAAGAARGALEVYPDNARIGLWAFSIDQGGAGVDHRVLVPLRPLAADAGARSQRQELARQAAGLPELTTGGTGLYDTALAAYRQALTDYDPGYFNAVVIMTDGANDDPGSISLPRLIRTLKAESDPQRPVRIITIGISEDADMAALKEIAQATNGAAYPVADPRDILDVVAQALLGR